MIVKEELKFYRAERNTDASNGGGRMSPTEVLDDVRNNLFPDPAPAERTAGVIRTRKALLKVANDSDETLAEARACLATSLSSAGDRWSIFVATQDDELADIDSPEERGVAALDAQALSGATSFTATLPADMPTLFRNGDSVAIFDPDDPENGSILEVHENVTVSNSGLTLTITLDGYDSLFYDHAAGHVVAACLDFGDLACALEDADATSTAGTFDDAEVLLDNLGTEYDSWTITFTGPTAFTVAGAAEGALPAGSTGATYAPTNPSFSRPYFTIPAAVWGGTFEAGDTVTFVTIPAVAPVWVRQRVPAGMAASDPYAVGLMLLGQG